MSVQKLANGQHKTRWRDAAGQSRSRTFARKGDADALDLEMKRRRQLGPVLAAQVLDRDDRMTLAQFVAGPSKVHAPTAAASRAKYAWALEKHLVELLPVPLAGLTVPALSDHMRVMKERGATANTRREVFMYLGGVLQLAAEQGRIQGNPVPGLRKADRHVRPEVQALTPAELEVVLAGFTGRDLAIATLGGRLGLRPLEIRRARWDMLGAEALHIGRADTKETAARARSVKVPRAALATLRAWQLQSGGRGNDLIVGEMTESALKQWGTKRLRKRVATATGKRIVKASTYALRHSHASALHYAGHTLPEAARRMGHTQQTHMLHYAHVLEGLEGQRYANLDALYAAAQATHRPHQESVGG